MIPRPTAASSVMPIDWSTRPISSIATQRLVKSPPAAAVLLRGGQPEQAELTESRHDLDREVVLAVPAGGVRGDLRLGELADDLAERLVLVGQLEVHSAGLLVQHAYVYVNVSQMRIRQGKSGDCVVRPGRPGGRTWTITELAREFGVTQRTLRFYEEHGLLTPERRGTQRVFHAGDRVRLELVLRGKRLGFPLEEIKKIVGMYDAETGEVGQLALPARADRGPALRARTTPLRHRAHPGRARRSGTPLPRGPRAARLPAADQGVRA